MQPPVAGQAAPSGSHPHRRLAARLAGLPSYVVIVVAMALAIAATGSMQVAELYYGQDDPTARRLLSESGLQDLPGDAELSGCSGDPQDVSPGGYPALAFWVNVAARKGTVEEWASVWGQQTTEPDGQGGSRTLFVKDGTTIVVSGGSLSPNVWVRLRSLPVPDMTKRCFQATS